MKEGNTKREYLENEKSFLDEKKLVKKIGLSFGKRKADKSFGEPITHSK